MPVFDAALHDININGNGYMRAPAGDSMIPRQDAVPHIARTALGEGRYDLFQIDSFYAQADWEGGIGQARLSSADAFLSGVGDSRFGGHFFPARKSIALNDGGTAKFHFSRGSAMYGFVGTDIQTFGGSTADSAGAAPRCQPDTDGDNNAYYVTTTNAIMKWTGTGAATNITPSGFTAHNVRFFGRHLFAFGTEVIESTPTLIQSAKATMDAKKVGASWTQRPRQGNLLIAAIASNGTVSLEDFPDGWAIAQTTTGDPSISVLYKSAESYEPLAVQIDLSAAASSVLHIAEFKGLDINAVLMASNSATAATSTSITTGTTGTLSQADALSIVLACTSDSGASAIAAPTSDGGADVYTEIAEAAYGTDVRSSLSYFLTPDTTAQSATATVTSTGNGNVAGIVAVFKGNTITTDTTQFSILYSSDGGNVWNAAFSDQATGIGAVIASGVGGGYLFFSTNVGLYQMAVDELESNDGFIRLEIALREVERFPHYPSGIPAESMTGDTFVAGWIVVWQGGVFYPVGQTLRRHAIGATGGEQIWPTDNWGTKGGNVKAVAAGEGGVFFGAGEFLMVFNGRGFHCLATSATTGIYDYMYWHSGRLYLTGDPCPYYDFGYPALRPDIYATAATNFETGYMVSSMLDFEKVDVDKLLRRFMTQAEFTAASDSGTITLAYLIADTAGNNPDRLGGGATSLTWTSIGTHTVTDGNVKQHTLGSVLKCKNVYLRVTVAPGASGYPILHAVSGIGRTIMPGVRRFVVPLWLSTDTIDKQGGKIYPTVASIQTDQDALLALRNGTDSFTVGFVTADGTADSYTCTFENYEDALILHRHNTTVAGVNTRAVFLELP